MSTAAPVGSISFVTGVDHRMFDQLFPFMGSMRRYCPGTRLWVCDFSLTGQQKDLLHRMGVLLEMPAVWGRYNHAWYYKSALGRYVAALWTEAVVGSTWTWWCFVTALTQPDKVRVLDMLTWNMCGQHIGGAVIEALGVDIVVSGADGRTFVLHATSNTRGDVVVQRLRLRINTTVFPVAVKAFAGRDVLRIFQQELFMDALAENFQLLTECGFGAAG